MKLKRIWIPALLLTLIGGAAKICDTLFNVNGEGFFLDSFKCNCVFVSSFLLLYVIGYALSIADRKKRFNAQVRKNILTGCFGFLASVMIIGTGVISLIVLDSSKIAESLFAIAAGGILLYESCISFTGQNGMKALPVAGLILPVWCCLRFISLFSQYSQKSLYATEMFDIIALAFLVMFLFYQAMFFAGISNSNATRKSVVYGTVYIMLGLVVSVDLLIKMISGGEVIANVDTFTVSPTLINIMTIIGDIALCGYALFFTGDVLRAAQSTLRSEEEDDEELLYEGASSDCESEKPSDKSDAGNENDLSDMEEKEFVDGDSELPVTDTQAEPEQVDINTAVTTEYQQEEAVENESFSGGSNPENVYPVSAQPYEENEYDKALVSNSENEEAVDNDEPDLLRSEDSSEDDFPSQKKNENSADEKPVSELNMPGISSPAADESSGSDAYEELMQMLDDLSSGS